MKTLQVDQIFDTTEHTPGEADQFKAVYKYKVVKVTNSVTPHTSTYLTKDEVDVYCNDEDWGVTIK